MALNDGKQHVQGLRKEVRNAWRPYGEVTHVAKHPGAHHYGCKDKHPELGAKLQGFLTASLRITLRATMVASVLHGRCMYGSGCHYITKRQTQQMRRIMCTAMDDEHGRRPDSIRLLAERKGKWEPEIVRIKRMIKHWQSEERQYHIPQAYWEQLQTANGKQGPISLLKSPLESYGVACPRRDLWKYKGREIEVRGNNGLATRMADIVRRELWERQAQRRTHLRSGARARQGRIHYGNTAHGIS